MSKASEKLLSKKEEKELDNLNTKIDLGTILRRIAEATGDQDFKKTPLSEMADTGYENMADDSGYILSELKALKLSSERAYASKEEVKNSFNIVPTKNDLADIKRFFNIVPTKNDLADIKESLMSISEQQEKTKQYVQNITITSGELLSLNAVPRVLVPATGAGTYIEINRIEFFMDFETAAYTNLQDLSLEYTTSGQIQQFTTAGWLDGTSDKRYCGHQKSQHIVAENESIILKILTSEILTGDSPLKIRVNYKIMQIIE